MTAPKIKKEDVGSFLIDEAGNIYKIVSHTNRPTIELSEITTNQIASFVVGSKGLEKFTKLIKEEK